jgi:hypothetical protein
MLMTQLPRELSRIIIATTRNNKLRERVTSDPLLQDQGRIVRHIEIRRNHVTDPAKGIVTVLNDLVHPEPTAVTVTVGMTASAETTETAEMTGIAGIVMTMAIVPFTIGTAASIAVMKTLPGPPHPTLIL